MKHTLPLILSMLLLVSITGCQLDEHNHTSTIQNDISPDDANSDHDGALTSPKTSKQTGTHKIKQDVTHLDEDVVSEEFGDISEEQWKSYMEQMGELSDLFEQRSLVRPMYGMRDGALSVTVRKIEDPRTELTEQEIIELKEAIYHEIGERFPLQIKSHVLGETPTLEGKITHIDKKGQRVLIVNEREFLGEDDAEPSATWASVSDNTFLKDQQGNKINDDDLEIGQSVSGWQEMLTMTSYPAQTGAIELHVDTSTEIVPDITGVIKKVQKPKGEAILLTIDGVQYAVSNESWIWDEQREEATIDALAKGQHVDIWLTGLPTHSEVENISKIMIQSAR